MSCTNEKINEVALRNFIYIIGMPRGGTSVLRNAINEHDEILMLPEISHFMRHVWAYRNKVHMRLLRIIFQVPTFYNESKVLAEMPEQDSTEFNRKINKAFNNLDLSSMYKLYPEIYSQDESCEKEASKSKYWGDKSNNFAGVEDILKFMPGSKLVLLVRDPRSNVLSLSKRAKFKESFDPKSKVNMYEYFRSSLVWNNFNKKISSLKYKYPEQVKVVKFEDFLEKPEIILNSIFKYILGNELPLDELKKKVDSLNYGASNSNEQGKGISKKALARWQKELSTDEVKFIESICGKVAIQFKYDTSDWGGLSLFKVLSQISGLKRKAYCSYLLIKDRLSSIFLKSVNF